MSQAVHLFKPAQRGARARSLLQIDAGERNVPRLAGRAWRALKIKNDPPTLFRRAETLVRLECDASGRLMARELTLDRFRYELTRAARWTRFDRSGQRVETAPSIALCRDMLARPNPPLPVLLRMVNVPVFSASGALQTEPGYHPQSCTLYAPAKGFVLPDVPQRPTAADVKRARDILSDLLWDFPFTSPAGKAHAIALCLHPFVGDLIDGATPLHLIRKPAPGTGATLLAEVLCFPALGHPPGVMSEARDEDEWRRRIAAELARLPIVILLDNLRQRLDSAALSSAITAPGFWTERILGRTETLSVPVKCAWIVTANNPTMSTEIARRTITIELDAKTDRPWLRKGFKHDDLRSWVRGHRCVLAWAALTLIRAWLAKGRPDDPRAPRLGMFEQWSAVMGGILHVADIPGFLENVEDTYDRADTESAAWRAFVGIWWDKFRGAQVGVKDLAQLCAGGDGLLELGNGSERSQRTKLGLLLAQARSRRFGSWRIVEDGFKDGARQWKLESDP